MDIKEQIKALKAQAYDLLTMVEQYRSALGQVNQQIVELSQREKAETEKKSTEKPKEKK